MCIPEQTLRVKLSNCFANTPSPSRRQVNVEPECENDSQLLGGVMGTLVHCAALPCGKAAITEAVTPSRDGETTQTEHWNPAEPPHIVSCESSSQFVFTWESLHVLSDRPRVSALRDSVTPDKRHAHKRAKCTETLESWSWNIYDWWKRFNETSIKTLV